MKDVIDISSFDDPGEAAKAVHARLREEAKAMGFDPDIEIFIKNPAETLAHGYGENWMVSWECGDWEWAVAAAMGVPTHGVVNSFRGSGSVYAEPYYSFDLHFYGES